jgi:hypothetical protein
VSSLANDIRVAANKVDPTAPSVTKWHPVRNLIAEALGIPNDDAYPVTVSKPGNFKVRVEQSAAARAAKVVVAMCNVTPDRDVAGTVASAEARV